MFVCEEGRESVRKIQINVCLQSVRRLFVDCIFGLLSHEKKVQAHTHKHTN